MLKLVRPENLPKRFFANFCRQITPCRLSFKVAARNTAVNTCEL